MENHAGAMDVDETNLPDEEMALFHDVFYAIIPSVELSQTQENEVGRIKFATRPFPRTRKHRKYLIIC